MTQTNRTDSPLSQPLHQLRDRIASGAVDPRQFLNDLLTRIEQFNPSLRAYIAVDRERVQAELAERLAKGPRGRLFGVPITVKDNICVRGEQTTCASRILQGFRPPYDATVIERLAREGAVIIPHANMDEFAFGSSTENSAVGVTRNPWDPSRVPGGSSGGSAASVAADLAVAALGSDTGGSIRQPAALCGVVGMKPTYGRVSRYGLIAFASSLDQIGPITKDVTDCAELLSVLAGNDPRDSTSAPTAVPDYLAALNKPVTGMRFGLPKEYFIEGIDPEIQRAVEEAARVLESKGMKRVSVSLPHTQYAVATYYVVATAEASSNLARYDGVKYGYRGAGSSLLEMYEHTRAEGFGRESVRRIILGTYVLSHGYYDAYYLQGLKVRTLIKRDFDDAFKECDVILTPTSPSAAFKIGEKLNDPLQMYLSDIFTISANLAGIPAMSMPCGFTSSGLPIGMQLLGPSFEEARLLQVGRAYEQATEWHTRKPSLQAAEARN